MRVQPDVPPYWGLKRSLLKASVLEFSLVQPDVPPYWGLKLRFDAIYNVTDVRSNRTFPLIGD